MTRLYIPRVLSGVLLVGGGVWLASGVLGILRRLVAFDAAPSTFAGVAGVASTGVTTLLALLLVIAGGRWLTYSVKISADGISARLLFHRWDIPLPELKGVVLKQGGTTPQLRLVRRDGDVVVLPGWSLRARFDDGEVDDAGPALEHLGSTLGFGVKLITLTGTKRSEPRS